MSRKVIFLLGSFIMILLYSCGFKSTEYKDHISFNNIDSIQLVIKEVDTLLHKLPLSSDYKLKHFNIKKNGTLIINGVRINKIDKLKLNDFCGNNLFITLSDKEKEKLFRDILFLNKNEITDAIQGECFWQFEYLYKSDFIQDSPSHRMLIYAYNQADTSSAYFRWAYQILDVKQNLVLYKSVIYSRDIDDEIPSYPKIHSPYK